MAADDERAERIRQLKADHPDVTWRQIADAVGVTERAAQEWPKTGGIEPANAKAFAEFMNVDPDWLWRGPRPETPDILGSSRLEELLARLERLEQRLEDWTGRDEIVRAMLERQTEILSRIEELVLTLPSDERTEELLRALDGDDRPVEPAPPGRGETGRAKRPRRRAAG